MADPESISPEGVGANTEYCPMCMMKVVVFRQRYSTAGDRQHQMFTFVETICAYCGKMVDRTLESDQP
jgi:hypothetical protein